MAKRVFTANVVIRQSPASEPQQFSIGDEVPEWANVGDHVTQGVSRSSDAPTAEEASVDASAAALGSVEGDEESDADADAEEAGDYDDYSVEELKLEAKERGLTGYSKLTREELIAKLEADDAEDTEA